MSPHKYVKKTKWLGLFIAGLTISAQAGFGQVNVLTQHNDNSRTGANLSETTLTTSNVNPSQFGKLFSCPVDGQVYAQPLVVSNVAIPSQGTHNVVYVATMHDSVYCFDANTGTQYWKINVGPSVPAADVQSAPNIDTEIGILSAPVIDTVSGTLYFVSRNEQPTGTFIQKLNAIDITTGAQKFSGPVTITGQYPGSGDGSVGGQVIFNSKTENQRPALLLNNGIIYIAWASHDDQGPYHGWVMGYDAGTLAQKSVFNTSPNVSSDGVWQAGNGLTADSAGNIYVMTGNGPSSSGATGTFGEAFIKLGVNADKTTSVLDWFEPFDLATLDANDTDLAAGGSMLLPGTSLLIGGGKSGKIYVLNTANLGHFQSGSDSQIHQSFQATLGHIHGSEVYWNTPNNGPSIYVWSEYDHLKQFQFNTGTQLFNTTPVAQSVMAVPGGMPGGMLSISASGSTAGTGIVWTRHTNSMDSNTATVPGMLQAFDASDITKELWNSTMVASRDDNGMFAKFSAPTIANGKVYAASFSNRLDVYGVLPTPGLPVPGTIEAESYNAGGEGVGYHDTTSGNATGGGYRYDNMDITTTTDTDTNPSIIGPLVVTHFDAGEWLKYNVNVAAAGTYNCQFRTAGGFTGEGFHLEVDGTNVTGTVTVPNTGSWSTWATTTSGNFSLTAGQHTLRLVADTGGADINYMVLSSTSTSLPVVTSAGTASGTVGAAFSYQITATNSPTSYGASSLPAGISVNTISGLVSGTPTTVGTSSSTVTATNAGGTGSKPVTITINAAVAESPYGGTRWTVPGQIEAENYDLGGEGVAYHDTTAGDSGSASTYRSGDSVDVSTTTDGTTYKVSQIDTGEWLNYMVNVTASTNYIFQARVGTAYNSLAIHMEVDGVNVTGSMAVPNTGGWETMQTISSAPIAVTAGSHTIRVFMDTYGYDLNWIKLVTAGPSYKINAGGAAVAPFTADQYFTASGTGTGSTTNTINTTGVTNAAPAAVYQTERYGGDVFYTFPSMPVGASYHVRLHFAETYWTASGKRQFNIIINGTQVLTGLDIFAEVGANKADVKDFNTTVNSSGQIVLQLHRTLDNAKISGLEITPN